MDSVSPQINNGICSLYCAACLVLSHISCLDTDGRALTVGSYRNPGGQREKEHKDDVGAEEEPTQGRQVEEPGGSVGVEGLLEQVLKVGLTLKGPDGPQTL